MLQCFVYWHVSFYCFICVVVVRCVGLVLALINIAYLLLNTANVLSHCVFSFQFNLFSASDLEECLNEFWCAFVLLERNQPPVSRAGPDKVIWLPVDTLTLDGSNSTDDQKILSYTWSLIGWVSGEIFVLLDFHHYSTVEWIVFMACFFMTWLPMQLDWGNVSWI